MAFKKAAVNSKKAATKKTTPSAVRKPKTEKKPAENKKKLDYFAEMKELAGNAYVKLIEGGDVVGGDDSFVDLGAYSLNALVCGSIWGGQAERRVTAFAGPEATGKTYYTRRGMKAFLEKYPNGGVFHFESEMHPDDAKKDMIKAGIDVSRVIILPVATLQEFRTQALRIVNKTLEIPVKQRRPTLINLDSLGMLSTDKEMEDTAKGADKRDMTRQQLVRGAFRTLTLKAALAGITVNLTNHTYEVVGAMFPTKEMAGGGGVKYAASTIIYLAKSKERDADLDVTGVKIRCTVAKSRLTKEFKSVYTYLDYDRGLNRYGGLIELALDAGIFKKTGDKKIKVPHGGEAFAKSIMNNPEKYFTKEILDRIDEYCKKEFMYGAGEQRPVEEDEEEEQTANA